MKKAFLVLVFISCFTGFSQESYFVFFTNKMGTTFNPTSYFDAKALERKTMFGISISDSSDFPVSPIYIKRINEVVLKTGYESRWFNGVYVWANASQIDSIRILPFVKNAIKIKSFAKMCSFNKPTEPDENQEIEDLAIKQLERMQGSEFQKNGITGKGIRIAVFDGGFPEVDTHRAFEIIRKENRIIKTYDFTKKKEYVYSYNSHGLSTFSNIAGVYDSISLGLATGAEFLLARTEVNTEPFAEEQYWLAAAEWADKNGAHIISSSLGYTSDRYFPEQMDGECSLVAKAANMASDKGMLVINAMGNDGDTRWKVIGTPADADRIISVGGIDPETDYHINFSSFGPTKDGRLKPNVVAFGKTTVASTGNSIQMEYGTSFSTPLVAGFAACAWQTMIEKNNLILKTEIEKSADLYPYYDYAHGYGVPLASYFVNKTEKNRKNLFSFNLENDSLHVVFTLPLDSIQQNISKIGQNISINEATVAINNKSNYYLYYHIAKPDGKLARYGIVVVHSQNPISFKLTEIPKGYTLRISYKGGTQEWTN